MDAEHKFIRTYATTPANVHDSQVFDTMLDIENADPQVRADSAYRSEETEAAMARAGFESHIHEKGQSNAALTDAQQARNREPTKVRARVEHIFGSLNKEKGASWCTPMVWCAPLSRLA